MQRLYVWFLHSFRYCTVCKQKPDVYRSVFMLQQMHTNLSSSILSNSVKNPLNCQLFVHQNILLCAHVKLILLIMEVIHVSGNPGNIKSSPRNLVTAQLQREWGGGAGNIIMLKTLNVFRFLTARVFLQPIL